MELNEAITELEEHGYLLNEWKATPDFDELSPEDKVTLTKVKVHGAKDAEHKAEKPKKPAEIWFEKYKDRSVKFKILGLQCYAQKFVHGEPTDFVIINKSGVKNSKVSNIYKGSDENARDALHQAIKNDKFTNHVRVDARKEETPWEYITWLTPFGKAELVKTAKIHPEAVRIQTSDGPITDIPAKYVYAFIEQYIHE